MEGNDHDNRPGSDRQYREGLMTGLLIALANQVGQGWSTAIIIATLVLCVLSSWGLRFVQCFSAV